MVIEHTGQKELYVITASLKSIKPAYTVLAVVVTYQPDKTKLSGLIACLEEQASHCLIVDNTEPTCSWLKRFAGPFVKIIQLEKNYGIAYGQNLGIDYAFEQKSDYILFLDQDSVPQPGMVRKLVSFSQDLEEAGELVAAVGPVEISPQSGDPLPFYPVRRRKSQLCPDCLSSAVRVSYLHSAGTLIKSSVFRRVGALDSSLFIDLVDMEWCFRAASRQMNCFGIYDAHILHQVGEKNHIGFGRLQRSLSVHPPERNYYQIRNSLLLMFMPHIPKRWLCQVMARRVLGILVCVIFFPERQTRLRYACSGFIDGLKGKGGKYGFVQPTTQSRKKMI